MFNKSIPKEEQRRYKRLDTIFPVEVQLLNKEGQPISSWHQGFSQDVSKDGICLTINNLSPEESLNLNCRETKLLLQIHSPFSDRSFLAYTQLIWLRKVQELPFPQFVLGLNFTKVDIREINRLIGYIMFKKTLWRLLQFLIVGLLLILSLVIVNNFRLNAKNLILINQYSELLDRDLGLTAEYKKLLEEKEFLVKAINTGDLEKAILIESIKKTEDSRDKEIEVSEQELLEAKKEVIESEEDEDYIRGLKEKLEELRSVKDEDVEEFQKQLLKLQEREKDLNNKLSLITAKESALKGEFQMVDQDREPLVQNFKAQLYNWLRAHQNQKQGLVVSYEGDRDLQDVSYIYDQSLAIIAYTLFGDYDRAKAGLDFFLYKAKQSPEGGFYNAYYASNGQVAEFVAHAGPNLWLGIAILQYSQKSKDYSYLRIAEQIAKWVESLQDEEGGIKAGENLRWHSTEHNLDGFAFFNMFYELTKNERFKATANQILTWLEKYAYSNEGVPVKRGKGDSTIATDTYAWSISALGPELLNTIEMDPDKILEFARENCLVETDFSDRFGKVVTVRGFDFAKHQHLPRGGVISCEWTAQMVLSFNIMADYYFSKEQLRQAAYYQNEATKYLNELSKMVISSPSAFGQGSWCLPTASQESVDTGHGWRTPSGKRTGSVAATAYFIFAVSEFNPLKLSK